MTSGLHEVLRLLPPGVLDQMEAGIYGAAMMVAGHDGSQKEGLDTEFRRRIA